MKRISVMLRIFLVCFFFSTSAFAATIDIDLNTFIPSDPPPIVTIDPSGDFAVLTNTPPFFSIWLYNDNTIDPIPADLISLQFDFDFAKPPGSDFEFFAFLYDSLFYDPLNPVREFFTNTPSSGTVSWNLTGLDPSITGLGLEFQVNTNGLIPDGQVRIGNLSYRTYVIPEPASLLTIGMGLLAWTCLLRRVRQKE